MSVMNVLQNSGRMALPHILPNNSMNFTENQHGNFILDSLRYQRECRTFCDVMLLVDGEQFEAHRCVLASCSTYFEGLFRQDRVLKEQLTISCGGHNIFRYLLDYIYCGNVVVDKHNVSELVRLANHFEVVKLKGHCSEYLERYLEADNCLSVMDIAAQYQMTELYRTALAFARLHANDVLCRLEAMELPQQRVEQLITNQELNLLPERQLMFILDWVRHSAAAREHDLRQLLLAVPLQLLDLSIVQQLIRSHRLFADSERCLYFFLQSLSDAGVRLHAYDQIYHQLDERFMRENDLVDNDTFLSMAITTAIEELEGTEATIFDGLHRLQQQAASSCQQSQAAPIEAFSFGAIDEELSATQPVNTQTAARDLRCHIPPSQQTHVAQQPITDDLDLSTSAAPLSLVSRSDRTQHNMREDVNVNCRFSSASPATTGDLYRTTMVTGGSEPLNLYIRSTTDSSGLVGGVGYHSASASKRMREAMDETPAACGEAISADQGQCIDPQVNGFMTYAPSECYDPSVHSTLAPQDFILGRPRQADFEGVISSPVVPQIVEYQSDLQSIATSGSGPTTHNVVGSDLSGLQMRHMYASYDVVHSSSECLQNYNSSLAQPVVEAGPVCSPRAFIGNAAGVGMSLLPASSTANEHQMTCESMQDPLYISPATTDCSVGKVQAETGLGQTGISHIVTEGERFSRENNVDSAHQSSPGDPLVHSLQVCQPPAEGVTVALPKATESVLDTVSVSQPSSLWSNASTTAVSPVIQSSPPVSSMPAKKRKLDPLLADLFREDNVDGMTSAACTGESQPPASNINYNFKKRLSRLSFDEEVLAPEASANSSSSSSTSMPDNDMSIVESVKVEVNVTEQRQLFPCNRCKAVFRGQDALKRHVASQHRVPATKTYSCDVCGMSTVVKKQFFAHMRTHFEGPPFECATCGKKVALLAKFLRHRRQHDENKPYRCSECHISFWKKFNLVGHMRIHSGERPFKCEVCGDSFTLGSTLRQHQRKHETVKTLTCDQCPFSTKYTNHLNLHKKVHTGDLHHCSHTGCSYTTPKRSHLREHLQSHAKRRTYQCPNCDRAFNVKTHLSRHMKTHQQEKQHQCSHCQYATHRLDRIKKHLLLHERPKRKGKAPASSASASGVVSAPDADSWLNTDKTTINQLFE